MDARTGVIPHIDIATEADKALPATTGLRVGSSPPASSLKERT